MGEINRNLATLGSAAGSGGTLEVVASDSVISSDARLDERKD